MSANLRQGKSNFKKNSEFDRMRLSLQFIINQLIVKGVDVNQLRQQEPSDDDLLADARRYVNCMLDHRPDCERYIQDAWYFWTKFDLDHYRDHKSYALQVGRYKDDPTPRVVPIQNVAPIEEYLKENYIPENQKTIYCVQYVSQYYKDLMFFLLAEKQSREADDLIKNIANEHSDKIKELIIKLNDKSVQKKAAVQKDQASADEKLDLVEQDAADKPLIGTKRPRKNAAQYEDDDNDDDDDEEIKALKEKLNKKKKKIE